MPYTRATALSAGTDGRRNRRVKVEMIATVGDVELVKRMSEQVGMTRERFEAWLTKSRNSPLHGREDARLFTVFDCNRVLWALKSMARRAEKKQAAVAPEWSVA